MILLLLIFHKLRVKCDNLNTININIAFLSFVRSLGFHERAFFTSQMLHTNATIMY